MRLFVIALISLMACRANAQALQQLNHTAVSTQGMVATVNPYATDAGVRALESGGNAMDAAIASALMLGVVDGYNSGLGGGCLIVMRCADGTLVTIDGRETAPAAATRDMYLRAGKAVPELSRDGALAVAVPGALAAYELGLRQHGKLTLSQLASWAAERAGTGFRVNSAYAAAIAKMEPTLDSHPGLAAKLRKPDGQCYVEGDVLPQPDLAKSLRAIADEGTDWFYRGGYAIQVANWMASHGGVITVADFEAYRAKQRDPVISTYRDYTIVGFPPPSSGGVHVAQILNILENFDLKALHQQDPAMAVHVVLEAMKLAFADRAYWLGDADFAQVPRGLVDQEYADTLAARIKLDEVIEVPEHGVPADWETNVFGKHTTHLATVDRDGNWVAMTATINTTFGSKVVVPGTGIVLNNEMDDFSAQPGVPNVFGLVGAENNSIEPGKRPLSCMSPTLVLQEGEPVMSIGAAGGPRIISQALLGIVRHLDLGMELSDAIAEPRFHHQWAPRYVRVEETYPEDKRAALRALGHEVRAFRSGGVSQGITRLPDGSLLGVHDPRIPGKCAGPQLND